MNNVLSIANDVFLFSITYYDDRHFVDLLSSNSSYNRLLFINYFNLNGYEVVEDCINLFISEQQLLYNRYICLYNLEDVYRSLGRKPLEYHHFNNILDTLANTYPIIILVSRISVWD